MWLLSPHKTAGCEVRLMVGFSDAHDWENLNHQVCWSKGWQDSKCIILHVYISFWNGIPFFKRKFVKFREIFNEALARIGLLMGNILSEAFELTPICLCQLCLPVQFQGRLDLLLFFLLFFFLFFPPLDLLLLLRSPRTSQGRMILNSLNISAIAVCITITAR